MMRFRYSDANSSSSSSSRVRYTRYMYHGGVSGVQMSRYQITSWFMIHYFFIICLRKQYETPKSIIYSKAHTSWSTVAVLIRLINWRIVFDSKKDEKYIHWKVRILVHLEIKFQGASSYWYPISQLKRFATIISSWKV